MSAYLTLNYDESNNKYESIVIVHNGGNIKFDTGDICVDHKNFVIWQLEAGVSVICSSSYDHFLMDTAEYVEKQVKEVSEGVFEFVENTYSMTGFTVIAKVEHKTFKELRDYVRSKKA